MRTRPGSTALELVLLAMVIGIFLAVTAPQLFSSPTAADASSVTVMDGLAQAQRLAVTEGRNVIVTFELEERRLLIHLDSNHDGEANPGEGVFHLDLGAGVEFGPGSATARPADDAPVTFAAGASGLPQVTFRRNGSASESGAIYLSAPGRPPEDARMVTLSRASGRGTVHAFADGEWSPVGRAQLSAWK